MQFEKGWWLRDAFKKKKKKKEKKFQSLTQFTFLQFVGDLMEHKPIVERVHGEKLETSALGLMFYVKPKYVKSGLKLECTASIGSVYWQSFLETPKVSPKEQIAISGNWWTTSDANGK